MPSLIRVSDGAGDSGSMSTIINIVDEKLVEEENQKPRLGWAIRVGTNFARSYSRQDWWMTTKVTEILEETDKYVRFKTKNSEYEWRA